MRLYQTEIVDTYAEAFRMWAARVVVTAASERWRAAVIHAATGFATSIIGCKVEAGLEALLEPEATPDGRLGASLLFFATDAAGLGQRLVERVGQAIMTCPTTACYDGLRERAQGQVTTVSVGGQLRYFGDGFQISKQVGERRLWRIPVMEGEFVVDETFHLQRAVGGGNLLLMGRDISQALAAAEAAAEAMHAVPEVILPFPGGIVRSGSKVGSRYRFLFAATNEAYCPTLRAIAPQSLVPPDVNAVYEIVVDGLTLAGVAEAMRVGMHAAAQAGATHISAGNYGGRLGKYQIGLHTLVAEPPGAA